MKQGWEKQAARRYEAWCALLDFSAELAFAGMKAQGLSEGQAGRIWKRRWLKSAQEHRRADERIARRLNAKDKPS